MWNRADRIPRSNRAAPPRRPRYARKVPGVARGTEAGRLRRRAHRELVHVVLAQQDRARGEDLPGHAGVVRGFEVAQDPADAGGAHAAGAEDVLEPDRDAVERTADGSLRLLPVARRRLRHRGFREDGDVRVDLRIERFDPRKERTRQLPGGDLLFPNLPRGFEEGPLVNGNVRHDARTASLVYRLPQSLKHPAQP